MVPTTGQMNFNQPNNDSHTGQMKGNQNNMQDILHKVFSAPTMPHDHVPQTPRKHPPIIEEPVKEEIDEKITETIHDHPREVENLQPIPPTRPGGYVYKEIKTPEEEAKFEVEKESQKYIEQARMKLDGVMTNTHVPLFRFRSIFPFDLIPDELTIDISKVTITQYYFFWSKNVSTAMIDDISDAIVETSPFLSTLRLIDKAFAENEVVINNLSKADAIKARRMIFGLKVARSQGVDLNVIPPEELARKVEQLGKTTEKI